MGIKQELCENNYVIIPQFIEKKEAISLAKDFVSYLDEFNIEQDMQCYARSEYNYGPFLELLCQRVPQISDLIEEPVFPTYSYAREYLNGMRLSPHKDRGSCEVSLSVNLDCDVPWDFWILTPTREQRNILLNPGDAIVYNGLDAIHWRDAYEGKYCIQVFLHYVRSRGEHRSNYYDRHRLALLNSNDRIQF